VNTDAEVWKRLCFEMWPALDDDDDDYDDCCPVKDAPLNGDDDDDNTAECCCDSSVSLKSPNRLTFQTSYLFYIDIRSSYGMTIY